MEVEQKYTADEVAKMLNVTGETVRRWCREKKIGFIQFPGKKGEYRFSEKNVRDFLSSLNSNDMPVVESMFEKKEDKPDKEK